MKPGFGWSGQLENCFCPQVNEKGNKKQSNFGKAGWQWQVPTFPPNKPGGGDALPWDLIFALFPMSPPLQIAPPRSPSLGANSNFPIHWTGQRAADSP